MMSLAAYEYHQNKVYMKVIRRTLRDSLDPFDMPDERFREMYRFPRSLALEFLDLVSPYIARNNKCPDIPMSIQFCSVLNFYASGNDQRRVGSDAFAMMSQTLVSRCVQSFSEVIATELMDRFIQFPESIEEIEKLHNELQLHTNYPGGFCIADGSQIGITGLLHAIEYAFVNRKGYHPINTQFVVDIHMRILNINARYPGSTHDSLIWRSSLVNSTLRKMAKRMGPDWHYYILADHGYPLQPWILKPYDVPTTRAQKLYNIYHRKLRSLVERAIGLFKARFRCCLKKLHYSPLMSGYIIYSCAVLHNFLIANNYRVDDIDPIFDEEIGNFDEDYEIPYDELQQGSEIRDAVAEHFANN